ncbi:MAG: helix-hairpin-helix domain-containing protein [Deltaproteobacteria bacterium]|nr:helix-hairpin-helix domain-containing protein [Deltaproteobacteria bacterium]
MEKGYALFFIAVALLIVFFLRSFFSSPSFFDFKPQTAYHSPEDSGISFKPEDNAQRLVFGLPMDINTATVEELGLLPGIGPTLASRIIEKRLEMNGFDVIDELKEVKGIGDVKFNAVRDYIEAGAR